MQTGAQRIEAALAHLVAAQAGAVSIADASCAVWRRVTAALSPIVGQRGMAALYERSLYLTRTDHPVLSHAHDDADEPGNFATLHKALSNLASADAAAANASLLHNFYGLLSSLIGASLTERLLKSALDESSTDPSAQDPSP